MSESEYEMEHDGSDSDSDFEVIALNPNVLYETDDTESEGEQDWHEEVKKDPVAVEEIKESVEDTEISVDTEMSVETAFSAMFAEESEDFIEESKISIEEPITSMENQVNSNEKPVTISIGKPVISSDRPVVFIEKSAISIEKPVISMNSEVSQENSKAPHENSKSPQVSHEEPEKVKEEVVKCDTSMDVLIDDETCDSSIDQITKVRKKLKLEEYKQRRANLKSKPTKPLFDLPKRIANYELCDAPASLPLLILPTDPNCLVMNSNNEIVMKEEPGNHANLASNPVLYEEITIVSMGCNTDVTIPPQEDDSNLLVDIVNNLNKTTNVDAILNSSTTLFSSIQAVVQGKCTTNDVVEDSVAEKDKEHGEDKTIMHLRKDRLRPFKCTISTQTDSQPFFPPLVLTPTPKFNRSRNARNFRRKVSRSRSRSRSFSPSMDYEHRVKCNGRYSRSQHSTHSSSMTGSSSSSGSNSSGSESDDSSCSASSDSLKRFNDRQNFRFYNRNQRDQRYKYPEERKVVYIGELEEETTKEDIRKKFLNYGTILKISLHQKEDGLRYGFVTFAEVSCAYEVIDKFSKDPLISKYDIRFGGRRKFCKQTYADLDYLAEEKFEETQKTSKDLSFEELLKLAKKKITSKK